MDVKADFSEKAEVINKDLDSIKKIYNEEEDVRCQYRGGGSPYPCGEQLVFSLKLGGESWHLL